jgi:hypothetical protein
MDRYAKEEAQRRAIERFQEEMEAKRMESSDRAIQRAEILKDARDIVAGMKWELIREKAKKAFGASFPDIMLFGSREELWFNVECSMMFWRMDHEKAKNLAQTRQAVVEWNEIQDNHKPGWSSKYGDLAPHPPTDEDELRMGLHLFASKHEWELWKETGRLPEPAGLPWYSEAMAASAFDSEPGPSDRKY